MSRKNKALRAFLHQNPSPTIEQAWNDAWRNAQKTFHARSMQEMAEKLEQAEARVAELEQCLGEGVNVWDDYLLTGGGSPVAHAKFVRSAKAFLSYAQRLRNRANEIDGGGQ